MTVTYRRAGLADLDKAAPLFDAYRRFYGQPADLPRARRWLEERLSRGEAHVLLAERGREAVGFTLPNTGLLFEPRTAVVALLVGVLVTLFASLRPALRATRVPPIAAVREGATLPPGRFARFRGIGAGLTAVAGFAALGYGLFGSGLGTTQVLVWMGLGALLIFLGVALFSSHLVRPLAHVRLTGQDPPPGLLDQTLGLGQVLRARHRIRVRLDGAADVDRDDVGALLGLPERVRTALAAPRARDERDLALEPTCHGSPPSRAARTRPPAQRSSNRSTAGPT